MLRGPTKSVERSTIGPRPTTGQQCYSLNNWISLWFKVSSFHWATLMQDALDITGAGYEHDFIWLYTSYSILVQRKDTTQVYNSGVTDTGAWMRTSPLTSWMQKLSPQFHCISVFSAFLLYSNLLFSCIFRKFLDYCFPISGFIGPIQKSTPDTLSILNYFLNVGEGPATVASGLPFCPFQLPFLPWLKPLATQMASNLIFLINSLLGYIKNAYNQRGFSKCYLHNSQRTKTNADNEAIHNTFRNGWL